ncbi:hypothetical protein [Streptomyces sp. NPDC088178]|uniref:hypothetical protein n=1 Tax=Streptomyces sp. NPDC088178 TaxID=3365836 RepID=UPI00382E901C
MNSTDQIRAGLTALAAAEEATPSRVWAPIAHTGPCRPPFLARTRDCDCSRCCAAAPHESGCISTERTEQPECACPDTADYHLPYCPEYEGADMTNAFDEFTADEIRRCHEATEFDHECRVCTAVGDRPDEAIPGTDF